MAETIELWGAHATISRQAPQHSLVLVEIAPDMNGMITATPEQARRLAAALTQMADRIEGVKPEQYMLAGGAQIDTLEKALKKALSDTGQHHD